mgnify:CR=1 FL=1
MVSANINSDSISTIIANINGAKGGPGSNSTVPLVQEQDKGLVKNISIKPGTAIVQTPTPSRTPNCGFMNQNITGQ